MWSAYPGTCVIHRMYNMYVSMYDDIIPNKSMYLLNSMFYYDHVWWITEKS